ncbi:HlyD family type I secretion periplasmic adaptor subunit [Thaumasiovibrio sp. DFM-14]|uniref:HlyD family type I secretion periplasmic adaptor subunit n=1 Tax=Thaumasiovibrio sp. DFM-14 TaxID=3384792 RepID=UPI0039A01341
MTPENFNTRSLILFGTLFIALTVGGFLLWSMTQPLSSAAISSGQLVVETQRKKIQHLKGGWVKSIFVKEGQHVEQGDLLVELSNSTAEADFRRLTLKAASLQAEHDRIKTELDEGADITWQDDSELVIDMQDQINIRSAQKLQFQQAVLRRELMQNQYQQQKMLLEERSRGIGFQLKAVQRQLSLVNQEIDMTAGLLKKGFVSKTKMLELQRHQASVDAQTAELTAEAEVLLRQLAALEQQNEADKIEAQQGLSNALAEIELELRDVKQALTAASDVRARVTIRSEHTGTVVGLNVHSIGGVVNAGDVIMEIVPDSDDLIVEALVKPEDIDVVFEGLPAQVRLSAYSVRRIPPVTGEVVYVAADRLQNDGKDAPSGYLVRVKLDQAELSLLPNVALYPGMPAEVFILLEERTFWDYFTAPLFNSYYRSFRES